MVGDHEHKVVTNGMRDENHGVGGVCNGLNTNH